MTITSLLRVSATALCAGALLAGCGSSSTPTTAASGTAAPATSSASPSPGGNPALSVALAPSDLPAGATGFTQVSDGLLGATPHTDARVFANSTNTTRIEVDLAVDTGTGAATTDYTAYNASSSKQVATQSGTSTPSIGSQANEYVGTDTNGHSIVSLAFVQGTVICVVTMVSSNGSVDATVVEAVAGNQAQKIIAASL
jgi:hypothetical protein